MHIIPVPLSRFRQTDISITISACLCINRYLKHTYLINRNDSYKKYPFTYKLQAKPGTHHAIFVVCWTQRRRKDDCCMVCAHQRQLSPVDFTNATVVGPIRKTNRSNNCCMVCAGQIHLSHQPTGHRPITVKHFRDA